MKGVLLRFYLHRRTWRWQMLAMALLSVCGLAFLGFGAYEGAPPIASIVGPSGQLVASAEEILEGQGVFQRRGLMDYGSFFGDGASRGPDFTADALHEVAAFARDFHRRAGAEEDLAALRTRRELQANGWDAPAGVIRVGEAQARAFPELLRRYGEMFASRGARIFGGKPLGAGEVRALTAFFYWGAWVCATRRPGRDFSYTHNWPYDPDAGNAPSAETYFWTLVSLFGLFLGAGVVLYLYGQTRELPEPRPGRFLLSTDDLESGTIRPTQRLTYPFFLLAAAAFLVQALAGALTAIDFVRTGRDAAPLVPVAVTRSWHIMLQIFWFFEAWIGLTVFLLPVISGSPPPGQARLVRVLLWISVALGIGITAGILLGPAAALGPRASYWLGHQGWEFMELGRLWQLGMLAAFSLWTFVVWRATRQDVWRRPWSLSAWLFYSVAGMVFFFFFGLLVMPGANFALADFWRWMVVHMWVEATFEVFTTVSVACLLVLMGLVDAALAERAVFLAVLLFLVTSLNGIAHNYYWVAKPTGTLALGSVFSTLQVLPLLLLTLDAWRQRKQAWLAERRLSAGEQRFELGEVWLFVLATNFWNVFGAGALGSLINLPIVNYFEHSTYLTGNHAHAAMFGVKGNIAIAGLLFCVRHLLPARRWNAKALRAVFWSLNGGLVLMMALDLFPLGLYQLWTVLQHGLWYARSEAFVNAAAFQGFTWMRSIGGSVFLFGGVGPLAWFLFSRRGDVRS